MPGHDSPYKRRTRAHIIAAQCRNFVERCILDEGYASEGYVADYGYDLFMTTYDEEGYVETGQILIQLKATDAPLRTPRGIALTVDVRDFRLWTMEPFPVFLIVYDGVQRRAYWLYVQSYFEADAARRPRPGAKTVRVFVPEKNEVGPGFAQYARGRKADVLNQLSGRVEHRD